MSEHLEPHQPLANRPPLRRVDPGNAPSPQQAPRHAVSAGKPSNESPQQFTPKFLLWVLSKYWKVVIPAGLLLAGVAASALLYTYEPEYVATGLIRIEDTAPYIAFKGASEGGRGNGSVFVRTQIELMRSPVVLREVLADERVGAATHLLDAADRLQRLREVVKVRQIGGSELYEVSYQSPSAQESTDVVSAVIQKYFARQSDENYRQVQRVVDLLEKERARRQVEVERLQQRVIELSREVTGKDPFGHNTMIDVDKAISPLASLHQQLTDLDVRIEVLKAEVQSLEESNVVSTPYIERSKSIDLEVDMAPEVQKREQAIAQVQDQMREYQKVSRRYASDPNYVRLKEYLQRANSELAEYKVKLRQRLLLAKSSGKTAVGVTPLEEKKGALRGLELRQRTLQSRFDKELANVQDSGGKGAELEFAKAELAREAKVFEMIAARKLALQTETKAPARVSVMDKVSASPIPVESAPWKKLFMVCTLAMAAPFGVAVLREVSLRRITDAEQLYEDTRLRVLGEVSAFPARRVAANPRQLPRKLRREMHAFAESIDALRMSLTFTAPSHDSRVVALTSAVSGEGKTSVSVALAMSFANATKSNTLLIDGDMRDPGVQDLVDIDAGPGLSEVLSSECALHDAIKPAKGVDNLFVLPAGKCDGTPHHFTQPHRLAELIKSASNQFSTVVIDTPPVLGASETLSICRSADLTAVCALRGASRGKQIRVAVDKLETAGATIAGSVLSGVPTSGYSYLYAYGYGYQDQSELESEGSA